MIKIENVDVYGFDHAIRGMRNPMNSWDRSDSEWESGNFCDAVFRVGEADLNLMKKLSEQGAVHSKYMRMITVMLDITAPLYWWKEFDTYKVGTVANSCSTMHKIHAKEFTIDDFSHDHLDEHGGINVLKYVIRALNEARDIYVNFDIYENSGELIKGITKKQIWWQMIQLLPSSYNQKRTVQLNYEVLKNMYTWRKNHKLDEWCEFCKWIESLPYAEELIVGV